MAQTETVLNRISQAVGIVAYAREVFPTLNSYRIEAIIAAEVDPTAANLRQVIAAYALSGQGQTTNLPPGILWDHLIMINRQMHPEDTFTASLAPWGAVAAIVIFAFFFSKW